MGEQPGAGRAHSFKIKGHYRQRRAAKPYSRPSDRKKGVLESFRDFFSPSWLLDFWKGKKVVEEDEIDDFDDVNDGEEPPDINQDVGEPSRVLGRPGISSTFERVSGVDRRNELLGNGGPGFMASAQEHTQTSHKSKLSALLAVRSRDPLNKKAFEAKTTAFTSSSGECSTYRSSSRMESAETQEGESLTQDTIKTPSEPSPILSSSDSKPRPSSIFGTNLKPGSSSTPVSLQTTQGLSFISSERLPSSSRPLDNPGPSLLSSERLSSSSRPQDNPGPSLLSSERLSSSSRPQDNPGPSLLSSERLSLSSRPQPTSVFRGKPEFSLSAFGSVLPSKSISQRQRYSSPYYSGKTIFGGASLQASKTAKRARISSPGSSETSKPVKRQIRPTPLAGTSSGGVASQTAKRILEALEKMSSPLEDAKKIPPSPPFGASSSPLSFTSKRRKAPPQPYNKPIGSPRKLQAQFGGPPVQSLSVPRRAVISRIQPKTDTTALTSQIVSTTSTTALPGKSSSTVKPIQSFVPTPLPVSLSPMELPKGSCGGKMRISKTSTTHYKSQAVDEQEHEVASTLSVITSAIPLTIPSGSSMPSFSFSSSSISAKTTSSKTEVAPSLPNSKSPDISSNNFKFSAPEPRNPSTNKTTSNLSSSQHKIQYSFSKPAPVNNSENNTSTSVKSPVLNSLDKFKPAEGSWDCSECFLNNKPDTSSCVACTALKPNSTAPKSTSIPPISTTSKPLNEMSKLPSNDLFKQFQQSSALLTNKQEDQKDISSPTKDKQNSDLVQSKDSLMKRFAPSSDSWECPSCMLNNKAQDLKCVCCQEQKPGEQSSKKTDNLLTKQMTPTEGSRTCDTSPFTGGFKVLSENKAQNSPFKFGSIDSKDSNKVSFGAPSSDSSNPFKVVVASTAAAPFVFGAPSTSSSSGKSFTFGSSTTTSKNVQLGPADSSNSAFKFGSSDKSSQLEPSFQFGKGSESSDATATFKFGSTTASTDMQSAFMFGSSAKKDNDQPASFSFGGNINEAEIPADTNTVARKESSMKPASTNQETKKVGSIAQAAAAGLLKIPSSVDVVDLTSDESKPDSSNNPSQDAAPQNVNFFAVKSITSPSKMFSLPKAMEAKPPTSSSLPPLSFAFGTGTTKSQADQPEDRPSFALPLSTTTSSIPKFGQTPAPAVATSAPMQGFQFGAALTSNVKTGAVVGTQISFTEQSQQSNVLPRFPSTNTTTGSPFVFKGSTDNTEKFGNKLSKSSTGFTGNGGFSFGSSEAKSDSSTAGSSSAPFAFGAAETQKTSGFTFGSSNQQPFAFGSSNPNLAVAAPVTAASEESMDADGNNNNNQPSVPSFGSTLAPVTQSPAPFSFTSVPANTGFQFGNVQQPGSFKFGDSSSSPAMFGSSTPAFGASTGNPLQQGPSSGFNFVSPANNSAGSQRGGFNFTGGSTSAFTAGSGTTEKRRVIKRGIRRTRK